MTNPLIAPVPEPDPPEGDPATTGPLEPSVTNPDADGIDPSDGAESS